MLIGGVIAFVFLQLPIETTNCRMLNARPECGIPETVGQKVVWWLIALYLVAASLIAARPFARGSKSEG